MFDIGFLELCMIGVVALIVIGPERLPEVAAKVGKTVAKAQRFVRGVRSDISREIESGDLKKLIGDQKSQIDELRNLVHSATKDIKSSTDEVLTDAEKSFAQIKSDAKYGESESNSSEKVDATESVQSDEVISSDSSSSTARIGDEVAGTSNDSTS